MGVKPLNAVAWALAGTGSSWQTGAQVPRYSLARRLRIWLITVEVNARQGCLLNSSAKSMSLVSDSAHVLAPGMQPSRA